MEDKRVYSWSTSNTRERLGRDFSADAMALSQHWGTVWTRAIALAWESDEFKQRLIKDPKGTFQMELGYQINPHLELVIEEDLEGYFDHTKVDKNDDSWVGLKNMQLTLYLPPKPEDPRHWAVALAEYADSGRSYPFTSL
jgi:ribosomally synthesized peptide (two-chain TOMM family)